MSGSRANTEPNATIDSEACYLLSRLLRAPPVTAYLRGAGWLHNDVVADALRAIHVVGAEWERNPDQPRRHGDVARFRDLPGRDTMNTEQVSETLRLSRRQVQRLARDGAITARRVGRRWEIDQGSVTAYRKRK